MQSELKSLSKIFSEVIFRIPDYQRGYSWETKHLKDFWNDIEQLPDDKSHYTGVLTLEPVNPENYRTWEDDTWIIESKHYSPMYVVDGQQRLTTAIILLQCILESIDDSELLNYTEKTDIRKKYICEIKGKGISRSYIFGYEKDNPSHEFLKQVIFGDSSINHSTAEETIYTKNLKSAKDFFSEKVKDLSKDDLEYIFTTLTQHLQFNIFYIEKDLDVFVTFETMNNRGKPLSHLELLKNRLIYLSTKFNVETSESVHLRKAINESWKSIYHYLGKINKSELDDDFLRTHFICYFSDLLEDKFTSYSRTRRYFSYGDDYKDYLLDDFFTPKRLKIETETETETETTEPLAIEKRPLDIETVFNYSQSIKSLVKTYYHTAHPTDGEWSDIEKEKLSQINRQGNSDIFKLCVAVLHIFESGTAREVALSAIERFGFLTKLRSYYFDVSTTELTGKVFAGKLNIEDLTKALTEPSDKFSKSKDFHDSIRNIGKNLNSGYYSWKQLRYFMFEYEQHLRKASKTTRQLLKWSDDVMREHYSKDHKTVEHIYPQKASSGYWTQAITGRGYSIKERNMLKNSIGNLLPVSHAKNASLSNKSFEEKKGSESNQVGYRYGCLSEIQVSACKEWTGVEILRRGIYLLDFLESRWNLKIGDASKKVDVLGLKFVLSYEKTDINSVVNQKIPVPSAPDERIEDRADQVEF
ncbi:DUF262 domain-containing protein [Pseudomonas koreensis]|uniref:DUF262 domain-containing protein n=1 Tax=Pseudomonas TaxID=286 RepID=UPI000A36457C|nr:MULTISPECIES: DUF262 domain-containing protein [Pseudomonas]NTZ93793.1 DUF262 domain-containing protein [Pseudomonas koreensis]